jgi:hypothetical protein
LTLLGATPAAAEVLYGADGSFGTVGNLYTLDPATGNVLTTVGSIGFAVTGLAIHPKTGVLYGSTSRVSPNAPCFLITVDKTTGAGTRVGPLNLATFQGTQQTLADLTFTSDGVLYGLSSFDAQLYRVDLAAGAGTQIGSTGLPPIELGAALAADGRDTIYISQFGDRGPLRTIDRNTGATTIVAMLDAPPPGIPGVSERTFGALAFNQAGTLYGVRKTPGTRPLTRPDASLVTIDPLTGHITSVGPTVPNLDAIAFDSPPGSPPDPCVPLPPTTSLSASVLPSSRSVQVGTTATAFAAVANATGGSLACRVGIALASAIPASFSYQVNDCATNAPALAAGIPANIPPGGFACYGILITPSAPFGPLEVEFAFAGNNAPAAPTITAVDTLLLSASATPVPDIVALAATVTNDGIVHVPGAMGTGAFAVATSNLGITAAITVSANTGSAVLPVSVVLCQTNPVSGQCLAPPGPNVATVINAGGTPTFGIFVTASGIIPLDPANSRIFVVFVDGNGIVRGRTSVAVTTQ